MPHGQENWRAAWPLDLEVKHLNHGSFGPAPNAVLEECQRIRRRAEQNPMEFFVYRLGGELAAARRALASFVGADADNLVLLENSTAAMNVVAASAPLGEGDEVLLTDHEYGAVRRTWEAACQRSGATLRVQALPTPFHSPEEVVDTLMAGVTPRTRLLVFSHVTSPTAIIFPAKEIRRHARQRGLAVCIDGPHAVAMLPLELGALDCDYYVGSCHKWLSAPFGACFLHVHPRAQEFIRPAQVSWGRPFPGEPTHWRDELHWRGTYDPSPVLAIPRAIEFLRDAGLNHFRQHGHRLARLARDLIGKLTGLEPLTPDDEAWYGTMVALPLPDGNAPALQDALRKNHHIEAPIIDWNNVRLVRVSCHLYTQEEDIEHLARALAQELGAA